MVTSNTRHSGSHGLKHQWSIPVAIQENELFSSWLARSALTQGCDPLVLTGEMWGKWRIWTIDADRIYDEAIFRPVAHLSGNTVEAFKQNSLYPIASKIIGDTPPEKAIWPWILALGARNTKRSGGLQYCPACLAEDAKPYFRNHWRLAWHTVCEKHQCSLLDHCHVCNAPIEPHRLLAEDRQLKFCATCKSDLSHAPDMRLALEALTFQRMAGNVILNVYGVFQQQQVNVADWFRLADFFVSMIRRENRSRAVVLHEFLSQISNSLPTDLSISTGTGIELLRTNERHKLFACLYQIMTVSKDEFERIALETNITRQAFCSQDDVLPEVLKPLYDLLPDNPKLRSRKIKRSRHQPRPRHEVVRMMARLERKLEMAQR